MGTSKILIRSSKFTFFLLVPAESEERGGEEGVTEIFFPVGSWIHIYICYFGILGDVLLHCVVDAILGALGLPDIGQIFPDSDPKWKGAPSSVFIKEAVGLNFLRWLYVFLVIVFLEFNRSLTLRNCTAAEFSCESLNYI